MPDHETHPVFVFGSNLAGRHGKGAALFAARFRGARRGQGVGRQGNSYGIPTKSERMQVLPLERIRFFVEEFLAYAAKHPDEQFEVTRVGCGLAGYSAEQIAPMFQGAPQNCALPEGWRNLSATRTTDGEPPEACRSGRQY